MIDTCALRKNPESVRISQRARGGDVELVNRILEADALRCTSLQEFEPLHALRKEISKSVGKTLEGERPAILTKAGELAKQVKVSEARVSEADAETDRLAHLLPNLALDGVPIGDEENFVVLHHEDLAVRDFVAEGFEPTGHPAIGGGPDAINTKRGVKVSGVCLHYLEEIGARLELTLMTMALDQAPAVGFVPMMTPTLVTPWAMGGTGFLNERSGEIYYLPTDDLYLMGTFEVAPADCRSDETLGLPAGPKRYLGQSTCYRREAGSVGEDTRGIIHVHQSNKAKTFSYCRPEEAAEGHERFLAWEEKMLRKVELPYRATDTAAGNLDTLAARKFDCEAWLPIQLRYMGVTLTSSCTTFQVRCPGVRERCGGGMFPVATPNGTLITICWPIVALGNHRLVDGLFRVPEALRSYFGGPEVFEPVK